jgi:hypothetical protein
MRRFRESHSLKFAAKTGLGAMHQDAEIFAVYAALAADFVFILFEEEDFAKEIAIAAGQGVQDAADVLARLANDELGVGVGQFVGQFQMPFLERFGAPAYPLLLMQHILTYRVNESAEPFGLADGAFALQGHEDAPEGFLGEVLDAVRRKHTGTEQDPEQLPKIGNKVLSGSCVAGAEAVNVVFIELEKLHLGPRWVCTGV